jgi:predicted nucleic acid-binding protein
MANHKAEFNRAARFAILEMEKLPPGDDAAVDDIIARFLVAAGETVRVRNAEAGEEKDQLTTTTARRSSSEPVRLNQQSRMGTQPRASVYLDASVVSALFDKANPERQALTQAFFRRAADFRVFISEVTVVEIEQTPDTILRNRMKQVAGPLAVLALTGDAERLANEYVRTGAVPATYLNDALHIAISVVYGIDYLLSWNFRHIVRKKTMDIARMVNTLSGLGSTEIATPAELL